MEGRRGSYSQDAQRRRGVLVKKIEARNPASISPQLQISSLSTRSTYKMSVSKIMALVEKLSASEKLQLNEQLAASMVGQSPVSVKASSRKGKPAAAGTMAWSAFIAHAKETMPERFAPPALPKDRMVIAKKIREEDPAAYEAFCKKFLADKAATASASASSDTEAEVASSDEATSPAPAPAPAPPAEDADEAKAKAAKAAKAKAIRAEAAKAKKVAA